ncbi:MAG TPA: bifunctional riboflavin kinase/FAD synthetase [Actinomycetota bacterium]|nr:bifunctional riboflavin kinase/FAD synthetase [Actinomycetota bacterium]
MDVVRGIEALPLAAGQAVVTIGFFDGVHLGHRAVLVRTVDAARERGVRAVAVTFDRHPREILTPDNVPRLITTVERRASLIEAVGIDTLIVLEFTEELSRWPAEEFMRRVLAEGLAAVHVVVGANFTFGHRALGTVETLSKEGPTHGFTAEGVGLLDVDGRRISSSSVRDALAEGDLAWPQTALGRRFVLDGEVVPGHGRGKELGFPTANLRTWPRLLLPGGGIYAGRVELHGSPYVAAISVGTNPTFGVEPLHVEAYLLEYDGHDLRGQPLSVEFWARLRDEERFVSPEALVRAISDDVERTREIVSGPDR